MPSLCDPERPIKAGTCIECGRRSDFLVCRRCYRGRELDPDTTPDRRWNGILFSGDRSRSMFPDPSDP